MAAIVKIAFAAKRLGDLLRPFRSHDTVALRTDHQDRALDGGKLSVAVEGLAGFGQNDEAPIFLIADTQIGGDQRFPIGLQGGLGIHVVRETLEKTQLILRLGQPYPFVDDMIERAVGFASVEPRISLFTICG